MNPGIAIVGMACEYPDAHAPVQLWENVLAMRRAFRRIPDERLRRDDYFDPDPSVPDLTYSAVAAVIEGYSFDRVAYRVSGSTYRQADLAHWLALDVATRALHDAGFHDGADLPQRTTGVVLGNTLTGEFSRASVMRLRWPFVRRVVDARLRDEAWSAEKRAEFLAGLEALYKQPFASVGEETLAGGLSNTIAGRICNHFDLKGGGYTVDGACSSSLLSVINACNALERGDLDVAIAGGVDLSLDPFELIGFAKTGALAPDEMRVYDVRSNGFWPGEGCGFVILMRDGDAHEQGRRRYATLRGWGMSSDGSGGITRPDEEGQLLALRRAYDGAGLEPSSVEYFEGHGTGTTVGDETELSVLSRARREAQADHPAAIGTIKANIGHTKAAAGMAGLLKATLAAYHRLLPPTTGCTKPHDRLRDDDAMLRVLEQGEPWPDDHPAIAAVSAMGFGGINTHVVLEGAQREDPPLSSIPIESLLRSAQDAELFLLGAAGRDVLRQLVTRLIGVAERVSRAELSDLAAAVADTADDRTVRAAVVASTPDELASRLEVLRQWLVAGESRQLDLEQGVFLGGGEAQPRIGFLFPGQGAPIYRTGGALARRFATADEVYAHLVLPDEDGETTTRTAQPAIVASSIACLRVLAMLGVQADVAAGHSLGELAALHWGGAFGEETLLQVAAARGHAMADLGSPTGAMTSLDAAPEDVESLIRDRPGLVIAGYNGRRRTVVSGEAEAVDEFEASVQLRGMRASRLPVSHAFHSPLVSSAVPCLKASLQQHEMRPLTRPVASTVTGRSLDSHTDLETLLCEQVVSPVRFTEAMHAIGPAVDLFIEVGPGGMMRSLLRDVLNVPVVSADAGGDSLAGLLSAVGAAFAVGAPVKRDALFEGRLTRPFALEWSPSFFANPCELAPLPDEDVKAVAAKMARTEADAMAPELAGDNAAASPRDLFRRLVAQEAELPEAAIGDDDRMLSDLHLNSITVGRLIADAARRLELPALASPTDYADASIEEIAAALHSLKEIGAARSDQTAGPPAGVDTWVRAFAIDHEERLRPDVPVADGGHAWTVQAPIVHREFAEALVGELKQRAPVPGIAVVVPSTPDPTFIEPLLEAARTALDRRGDAVFLLVKHGGAGSGLAKTLHLESPQVTVCVVDAPLDHPEAVQWIAAEVAIAKGYHEVRIESDGRRLLPLVRHVPVKSGSKTLPLDSDDVLLVTGGGKGIAAESALALAQETGARLVLMGRSDPQRDSALQENLDRLASLGVVWHYERADVTDAEAVDQSIRRAEEVLGPITGVLHGAGTNEPKLLGALTKEDVLRTLAPKFCGMRNILAAIDPQRVHLLVAFGSIIARSGLPGEADYAMANEWLTDTVERWRADHPHCRCLSIEWSIWSGVGMGQRLGRADLLQQRDITPITPDQGVDMLRRLLEANLPHTSLIVSGRFGTPPTLPLEHVDLPLARFLQQPRVYYPGVELVLDAELTRHSDPYLDDHVFRGQRLFPAVLGMEAMLQAAIALTGSSTTPTLEDLEFNRPIVVDDDESVTLRIAALQRNETTVEVSLRSSETDFQASHFRAVCRFEPERIASEPARYEPQELERLSIAPEQDLYGTICFQTGRFQRVLGYQRLDALACVAEFSPGPRDGWFGQYLPAALLSSDPGSRDAMMHAIQACIPHRTLIPTRIERIVTNGQTNHGSRLLHATQRMREGDNFIYDLVVTDSHGQICEQWNGLHLRAVDELPLPEAWPVDLVGPYLQRRLEEVSSFPPVLLRTAYGRDGDRSENAAAAGMTLRRPDGKEHLAGSTVSLSASQTSDLRMTITGRGELGCDLEIVDGRDPEEWKDLLGPDRYRFAQMLEREVDEPLNTAATRVWTILESLKKCGAPPDTPVTLARTLPGGWMVLDAGSRIGMTLVARIREIPQPVAIGILVERGEY